MNTRKHAIWLPLGMLFSSLGARPLQGQEIIRSFSGLWSTPAIAAPLDSIADIDRDGVQDFLVGDSHDTPFGEVRLHSGLSGSLLRRLTLSNVRLGDAVEGLADVTGDGVADLMGSGWVGGRGHVWSGADFGLLWTGQRFDSGASIGDIDGDGIDDLLLAAFGLVPSPGSAAVYYGGRFTQAYSLAAPGGAVHYGFVSVALGDVDGDGRGDFAIGAPGGLSDFVCVSGSVFVHSGVDGHLLYALHGDGIDSFFGGALAAPGDLTGDGIGDLVVGAKYCCPLECLEWKGGRLSFYDARNGDLLGHVLADSFGGSGLTNLGYQVLAVGDLDGNGYGDVLTNFYVSSGERGRVVGTLMAFDGSSRRPIYRVWNPDDCSGLGIELASAGDVNKDDFPDYLASSVTCSRPDDRVDQISGAPLGVRTLGRRCGELASDRPLRIGATGVPEIGRIHPIHLSGIAPGTEARLLLGTLEPGPPGLTRAGGCTPLVRATEVRRIFAKQVRPGEGVATAHVSIPNNPALVGMTFHAQWLIGDPRRWSTSRVLAIEIQPIDPRRGW